MENPRVIQKNESSRLVNRLSKLRVCAYIRVSTLHDAQLASLENQQQYYEHLIRSNPAYEYCGIYEDAGISGGKANRPSFQCLLQAVSRAVDALHRHSSDRGETGASVFVGI